MNEIEVNAGVCGYLDSFVAFDEVNHSLVIQCMIEIPLPLISEVINFHLKEKYLT